MNELSKPTPRLKSEEELIKLGAIKYSNKKRRYYYPRDRRKSGLTDEEIYLSKHGLTDYPRCLYCDGYRQFRSIDRGYYLTCGCEDCKSKLRRSMASHAGVASAENAHTPEAEEKRKSTNLEKYGKSFAYLTEENQVKAKESRRNSISDLEKKYDATEQKKLVRKYGQAFKLARFKSNEWIYDSGSTLIPNRLIPEIEAFTYRPKNVSLAENSVADYVASLIGSDKVLRSVRNVIAPLELDIYIPEYKLAIEYNGEYWHKNSNSHKVKTDRCQDLGIRLIHIFGYQWDHSRSICKSIIASALGVYDRRIYARNCEVREIGGKEYSNFMEENHIHGKGPMPKKRLGLFYEDELVQAIGIGVGRFGNDERPELYRMATTQHTQVIGGFSKLLKHSEEKELVSFVDRSLFDAHGYSSIGFKFLYNTGATYKYYKHGVIINRQSAMKHKLSKLLGDKYDPQATEEDNMLNAGWARLWDCGNTKLLYTAK